MNNQTVKTRQISKCEVCNTSFIFNPLTEKGRFCSYRCYWSTKKGVISKNAHIFKKGEHVSRTTEFKKGSHGHFKDATIITNCELCNKEFKHFKSTNRKFCSYKCYWEDKKLHWDQKTYKDKAIRAVLKGLIKRPTSLEQQAIKLFAEYKLPYKYVGNGQLIIGGKNPDFVNTNGEKKLIEVGNLFHHKGDYVEKRRGHFAKYGWETYIFIGDKLDNEQILRELTK